MKLQSLKFAMALASCLGMLISPTAMAAEPQAAPSDVLLHDGSTLVGQVVDAQGVPQSLALVTLANHEREVAQVRADHEGKFSVPGLQGGVYRVSSHGQENIYRMWAPNTAPPVAQQGVTLVVGQDVVRGQYGTGGGPFTNMAQWIADHPIITAGVIGAAIAIPVALDDDDDFSSPSSP